ncbi:MAG: hypothetical protein Q8J63_02000 [Candidatus Aquicultor sp.]|nr:hypothetical protein [Candidatus Aquicultor sp.]
MNDGFGRLAKVIIFLAIIGVLINDVTVVATNYWLADKFARSVAEETAGAYRTSGGKQEVALMAAYKMCEQTQSKLTGFAVENGFATVEVETTPKKTLFAHRIGYFNAYLSGKAVARSATN